MSSPVPGPSSSSSKQPPAAPEHEIPSAHFYSVEYPGYVQPSSVPLAVRALGGHASLESAFRRNAPRTETLLELSLRPENPFAHPAPGDVVPTNNILLKVVKRKRRRLNAEADGGDGMVGEYTAEAVGVIPKTARFRGMVDYQYQPDMNDPVSKLRLSMDNMDVQGIRQYSIPDEKEDYLIPTNNVPAEIDPQLIQESQSQGSDEAQTMRSNLRLFPPPVFSRQSMPQTYNFKANAASMVSTVVNEETGEEKKRLINRMRWKGYGPASIMFTDVTVPDKPPRNVEEVRQQVDQVLLKKLQQRMDERAIWTRLSLFNQFTALEAREIHNSKVLLPLVCYVFQDGPWRDTLVRFSYDPRADVNARFYQRLYFRNANHQIERPSVATRRHEGRGLGITGEREGVERKQSHIFDGMTVAKETAAFQLCDIHDPMLKEMIEEEDDLRDTCHERDGWYSSHAFERIKAVLRHKFFSLLEGYIPTDEECKALLVPNPATNKLPTNINQRKLRAGKHNMAKGALPPEDAAAARLRAKLASDAKDLHQTRG